MRPMPRRRRVATLLLLLLGLAVGLLAPAPALAGTPTVAVVAPTSGAYDSTVTITAKVRGGVTGQLTTLQRKGSSGWIKVATKRLPATGSPRKVIFRVKVAWAGARSFRVVLAPKGSTKGVTGSAFKVTATAKTWLLSGPPSDAVSANPSVSADGRFVVFESYADLGLGTNGQYQVYLWDRNTRQLTLVSNRPDGQLAQLAATKPVISADGAFVAFETPSQLVAGDDVNGHADIYRWNRVKDAFLLVSKAGANLGDAESHQPSISADGQHIAFDSMASNLDGGAVGLSDVFLWDYGQTAPALVSHGVSGAAANGSSQDAAISGDGNHVAFDSLATTVFDSTIYTGGDANGQPDVFIWDRAMGDSQAPFIVSTNATGLGTSTGGSRDPSVSVDGTYVAFDSSGQNINASDNNSDVDVFVWNRNDLSTITLVTNAGGTYDHPTISADGSRVAFAGQWLDLMGLGNASTDDVILWKRATGGYTLLSRTPAGAPGNDSSGGMRGPRMSPNGQWFVFESSATDLVSGVSDSGKASDVFLRGPIS